MDELRLTGNCMKGSRPILTFDESFDRVPHLKVSLPNFREVGFVGY
jgi:ribosome biogenesis protein BRX1